MTWQLQEAKQKFSQLVREALQDGPQTVTRHGQEVVVVMAAEEYRRLTQGKPDFKEFLLASPDFSVLDLERANDGPRDIDP